MKIRQQQKRGKFLAFLAVSHRNVSHTLNAISLFVRKLCGRMRAHGGAPDGRALCSSSPIAPLTL
ncbi:hypothetical protein EYF80_036538 [Liparis tanakae]|uniref:Uncharacterized protein n=1 Tax=Liparis tanakae TaxID=230148 RepID=A0A4Z2GIC0_9TELE|nr:hypothetical protein EYF80_036538 [Liparis tanakae]